MTYSDSKLPISVLIPAKNEEANLPKCLASVAPADEIFVVDSQSSDRSVEIAEGYGAKVVQFYFNDQPKENKQKKKNWSLDNLPFRHEWVLIVDCDERITPALWDEIAIAIQNPDYDGYYINRRVYFLGKWIRHGGKYPDWNLRLFKYKKGHYETLDTEAIPNTGDNEVHEHVIARNNIAKEDWRIGYLKHDMDHIDFKNIYHWLDRHNRYSNWEAYVYHGMLEESFLELLTSQIGYCQEWWQRRGKSPEDTSLVQSRDNLKDGTKKLHANLFGTPVERKRFLRKLWVRVPSKPMLRFIIFYFIRLGFLDGKAGYIYGRLLSQYEYNIEVKLYELMEFGGNLNREEQPETAQKKLEIVSWKKSKIAS